MLKLTKSEPSIIPLGQGAMATVRRLTPIEYEAATASAREKARLLDWPDGLNPADRAHQYGVGAALLASEIAALAIEEWDGVTDAVGDALPLTPENARLLVECVPDVAAQIRLAATHDLNALLAERAEEGNA